MIMAIPMKPIHSQSGNHVAAGYDPISQTLRVEYKGGQKFDHFNVSPDIAQAAFEAPSFGRFLQNIIKPAHPAVKVKSGD